jgi:hypothetical protein
LVFGWKNYNYQEVSVMQVRFTRSPKVPKPSP